jgi:hypothetical protein
MQAAGKNSRNWPQAIRTPPARMERRLPQ